MDTKGHSEILQKNLLHFGNSSLKSSVVLPFYKKFFPKPTSDEFVMNQAVLVESCAMKIISGGIMGSVLGIGLGMFMGAMGDVSPIQIINGREVPQAPIREQFRAAYKATASKTFGWAKSFGVLTALFGGVECVIEKYRSKHDVWNPVASGCVVGATLSAKAGPVASCIGCVGFSAFSLIIDQIMTDRS